MVDYGVAFVQLRMKEKDDKEIYAVAETMRKITAGSSTRLIINDYPLIARDIDADGVHVGQQDMPYRAVREIVGDEMIVGLSTHTPQQTVDACARHPDYIGIGPVYATPTKKNPDRPIGISGMREMLDRATVPAVVLGSITEDNLSQILTAGARNFSMVRPINQSKEPEKTLREILSIYHRYTSGSTNEST
jgi:thiamine-phosphate pyrophosphorylase